MKLEVSIPLAKLTLEVDLFALTVIGIVVIEVCHHLKK